MLLPKLSHAVEEIFTERVEGSSITSAVFHVYDGQYTEMDNNVNWSDDFTNYRVNNTVQLGINPDVLQTTTYTSGSITVLIEHEYWDDNTNAFVWGTSQTKTLQVTYDTDGTNLIDDLSTYTFSGGHHIKVTVQSITGLNVDNLFLESQIKVERYYAFDAAAVQNASYTVSSDSCSIRFFWDTKTGAEDYELEWVHINDYKVDGTFFALTDLNFDYYLNSTRIEISDTSYTIPNIFDHGYVIFRVRAIGRQGDAFDHRHEGVWTNAENGTLNSHNSSQRFFKNYEYDPSMNWSHQVGYTEDGKRFEGMSFADGLGRGRQSISHNTETEQVIVSNVYYDELGRPVISDLPTPVDSACMKHFPDFNRANIAGTPSYQAIYFNQVMTDSCDLEKGSGFSIDYGAGKYYSTNNPDKDGANNYIPDAETYPYSRVDYINDFSGRVQYTSAAGEKLSQGFGHETRFVYPSPVQSDLNRLFGSEVGEASHYTKMITIDPNGQVYVQYTDMAGRVVASYLEGPPPSNTVALDSAVLDTVSSLLISGQSADLGVSYPSTTFEHTMFVSEDGESHTFDYSFSPQQYENACLDGSICFDCVYDLNLTVMDDCGVTFWDSTVQVNGSTFDTICNTYDTLVYDTTIVLPRGLYTVSKTLEVNQAAIDQYWCFYQENDTCAPSLNDIFNIYYANEPFIECVPDSTIDNSDTLNTCEKYRELMLQDMMPGGQYALYADSSGFMTSDDPTSIFYSDVWENTIFLDANDDTIFVANTAGDTVTPDQLTENEFIGFFEDEWALSLLPEHPEYCYLEFCETNLTSDAYNDSMLVQYTWDESCLGGYMLPLGDLSTGFYTTICDSTNQDPFFETGGGGASYEDSMAYDMNNYITLGTTTYSIYDAAYLELYCPGISTSAEADSCLDVPFDQDCDEDLLWTFFREKYLELKWNYYYKAMHDHAVANSCENDCIGSDEVGCEDYADKVPRFLNVETHFGYDPSQNLDSLQNVYSTGLNNACQSSCEQYATDWLAALDSCDFSALDSLQMVNLYNDLVDVCMAGCDSLHPFGATTTPPGDTTAGGHSTIDDVLTDYLGASYETDLCTELLINAPGPYQSSDDLINIVEQPLDTCACDAILQAEYDLTHNNPQGFTYVEEMLAYQTGVSMADVNYLICACEDAICADSLPYSPGYHWYSWNLCEPSVPFPLLNSDYMIPSSLSCNPEACDIDCATIEAEMDTLNTRFNHITDFENSQNYETIVENYLNAEFGYHLFYPDYQEFIDKCNSTSADPYCALTEEAEELPAVLSLLAYRGQLLNTSASEVELMDENIVYANGDLQYFFTEDDYWSSLTDSTLTLYLDSGNCSVSLTAFDGFDFSSIMQFGTLAPIADTCPVINDFEVQVTYLDCGQIETAVLNGTTSCLPINDCVCDTAGLTLCDDWLIEEDLCYEPWLSQMYQSAFSEYNIQLDSIYEAFSEDYNSQCAEAFDTEQLVHTTRVRRYQTTLFYYDQAGNLVKTVAPEGINGNFISTDAQIDAARASVASSTNHGAANVPDWDYETTYQYNAYNQLTSTTNPDQEGDTKFWYDRYGRIAASQNPVQSVDGMYSYTLYDPQGRPVEVGQTEVGADPSEADLKADDKGAAFEAWVNTGSLFEVTVTTYDTTLSAAIDAKFTSGTQRNLRLRVSTVAYFDEVTGSTNFQTDYESATHYAYDIHGNVVETIQDVPLLAPVGQDAKKTNYDFELISGNVQSVTYQKGAIDEMEHTYEYDKLNRLTGVYTAVDSVHKTREAKYFYYDYGPLARKEIGKNKVQGMDFAYTINGWLKGMNASSLDSTRDIGNDGAEGYLMANPEVNELVANDVVAYTLGYFDGDYNAIGNSAMEMIYSGSPFSAASENLYNGNIRHTVTSIYNQGTMGAAYDYDQLQRLKSMEVFKKNTMSNDWLLVNETTDYANSYSYDRNGNILTLQRNATSSLGLDMDNFTYNYHNVGGELSNQLAYVSDAALDDGVGGDILSGMSTANYLYDNIGQLLSDASEGISSMDWRYGDKKLKRILRNDANSPQIEFVYNPFGQRVLKIEKPRTAGVLSGSGDWIYTYYAYDANGQVMAVYSFVGNIITNQTVTVDEYNIYGSSREGQLKTEEVVWQNGLPSVSFNGIYQNTLGERNYEVTNHLGNVLAVVTDRNTVVDSTYAAVVMMTTDYYPFGMVMPRSCDTIAAQDCYDTIVPNQVLADDQFNTEVTDWVSWGTTNTVEIDWDNGKMHVKSPDRYRCAVRHIETVVGDTCTIDIDIDIGQMGSVTIGMYNPLTTQYTGIGTITSSGVHQFTFTANHTLTTLAVCFPNEFVNLEYWVDNFKVTGSKSITTCPEVYTIDDDFDVDQGDWVARNSPVSLTVANGGLTVEADSRGDGIYQTFTTESGVDYVLEFELSGIDVGAPADSTERVLLRVSDVATNTTLANTGGLLMFQDGKNIIRFTADSTSTRIDLYAESYTTFTPRSFTVEDIAVYSYDTTFTTPQQIVCHGQWENSGFDRYRYAYNGMEYDSEVSGDRNSYTTEFRQYDPRLARWKSLDPLMAQFPWQSPYCAFDNNPVYYVDPYGLQSDPPKGLPAVPEDMSKTYTADDGLEYWYNVSDKQWERVIKLKGTPVGQTPRADELNYYKGRIGQGYWSVPNNWRLVKDPEFRDDMRSIRKSAEVLAKHAQSEGLKLSKDSKFYDVQLSGLVDNEGIGQGFELTMFYKTSKGKEVPVRIRVADLEYLDGGKRDLSVLDDYYTGEIYTNCYALSLGFTGAIEKFEHFVTIAEDMGYKTLGSTSITPKVGDIWVSGDGEHVMEVVKVHNGEAIYRSTNYGDEIMEGTLDEINEDQFGGNLTKEGSKVMRKE